jgi:transcriptional regulator with XRE-family HTH domain
MEAKELGEFIAKTRKENQITQAELAKRLNVTDKAVSRWERGLGYPDINTLEPLADALGVSLTELMQCSKNMRDYRTGLYCVTKCCKARNYRLF